MLKARNGDMPGITMITRMDCDARRGMSENAASRVISWLLVLTGVAVLIAGNVWLWTHYGAAIFFETIRAGLVGCVS
jgi:hypothetical protein